jgi:hypothetical protein
VEHEAVPADWPAIVTRRGSPPKASAFRTPLRDAGACGGRQRLSPAVVRDLRA